jgi:maleate isomerase
MLEVEKQSVKGWRAEVGMLSPLPGMYREFDVLAPEGVRFSRAVLEVEAPGPAGEKQMAESIAAETIKLNRGRKKDLICFGCTSGSFIGGPGYDQKIIEKIEEASEGVPATSTTTCVLELFKDMGIRKIALVGPYVKATFDMEVEVLKASGIQTLYLKGLGFTKFSDFWDYYVDPYACYKIAKEGGQGAPEADCVFVTCMMSPIMSIVDALEKEIRKPIISSCSATMYGILKKLGIPDPVYHYGEALMRPRL